MPEQPANDRTPAAPAATAIAHDPALTVISERYARLYAPLALAIATLSFLPLFRDIDHHYQDGSTLHIGYGSVFQMAGRGGGPAVFGILMLAIVVVLLLIATFGQIDHPVVPVSTAIFSAPIALLLIFKPMTGSPTPQLSDAGTAGLALIIGTIGVTITHAIHLRTAAVRLLREDTTSAP